MNKISPKNQVIILSQCLPEEYTIPKINEKFCCNLLRKHLTVEFCYRFTVKYYFKYNLLFLLYIGLIRYAFNTQLPEDSIYRYYFGDVSLTFKYAGYYGIVYQLLTIRIINNGFDLNHSKWCDLLDMIEGKNTPKFLGFQYSIFVTQFLGRTRLILACIKWSIRLYCGAVFTLLLITLFFIENLTPVLFIICLLWRIHDCYLCYYIASISLTTYPFYYIVCYFLQLQLKQVSKQIRATYIVADTCLVLSDFKVLKLIKMYSIIRVFIECFNTFWRKYVFTILLFNVPLSAIILENLLFVNFKPMQKLLIIIALIFCASFAFIVLITPIMVYNQRMRVFKQFHNILKISRSISIRISIKKYEKLLSFLDYISSNIIRGFNIRNILSFNKITLIKILFLYGRYFLLMNKFMRKIR